MNASNAILVSLRLRILEPELFATLENPPEWTQEVEQLYKKGIGIDEVLQYLYFEKPTLEAFQVWIQHKEAKVNAIHTEDEAVLTLEDLQFFETHGYVVLRQALSKETALVTQDVIWEFLQMDPQDSQTWYKVHPEQRGLMVNFFEHPQLEHNRSSAKIRKAFEQLYQSTAIYKSIDKVSFNPPITPNYAFMGSDLHWDVSLQLPIPFRLQGLIYLSDCGPQDGAFHCVPGFHHTISSWMEQLPEGVHPRMHALQTLQPTAILGEAGDMIIWHQALPHCATPNYGAAPRMVQYLTYFGETDQEAEVWI